MRISVPAGPGGFLPIPSRSGRRSLVQPELSATMMLALPVPLRHDAHFSASPAESGARSQRASAKAPPRPRRRRISATGPSRRRGHDSRRSQRVGPATTRQSARQLHPARRCLSASSAGHLGRPPVANDDRGLVRDAGPGTVRRRARGEGGHARPRRARVRSRASPRVRRGSADLQPGHASQPEGSVSGLCAGSGSHAGGRTRPARVPARHSQGV